MSTLGDVFSAIEDFRAALFMDQNSEDSSLSAAAASAGLRGILGGLVSPLQNVHATGVGIRMRKEELFPSEFVIKVYVFQKLQGLSKQLIPRILRKPFQNVEIDIEELPVVQVNAKGASAAPGNPHQARRRPIVGGLQVQPRGASKVGTLGGFVRPAGVSNGVVFALSNNHVIGPLNGATIGSEIVQPDGGRPNNGFARLSNFEPIHITSQSNPFPPRNRMDAALARVTDLSQIQTGSMFRLPGYSPQLIATQPGMRVVKSGRTTGVTTGAAAGMTTAMRVNNLQVNYGTLQRPLIGIFDGAIVINGDNGTAFSKSGDSGSFILDRGTGRATALLFAGNGSRTFACDLTAVCSRFNVVPV